MGNEKSGCSLFTAEKLMYWLFQDVPTIAVMIGAAIVVSSGLAVVLSERNKPG